MIRVGMYKFYFSVSHSEDLNTRLSFIDIYIFFASSNINDSLQCVRHSGRCQTHISE